MQHIKILTCKGSVDYADAFQGQINEEKHMNRFKSYSKPLNKMWFMALLLAAFVAGCGGGAEQGQILGGNTGPAIGDPGPAGPSPVLGILSPFGIASAGGMTNTGATKINGNVVLDPNQTCNAVVVGAGDDFGPCGGNPLNVPTHNAGDTVITQIHPDTTTADAVMAVLLAKWNSISPAGRPGATILGCGTIGSAGGAGVGIGCNLNSTLPPGAYISATNSTIGVTGDLTLDAGGNADAVWVFQAPSALDTATSSRILLTGGAKASNVWWFVGSSATLLAGTTFQGNILASASISMQVGATSCGRLLAGAEGAGTFAFLANTVSVPGHPNAPVGCQ
ncbi:MAG TPA: ice-binding family protein [Acidiferrobacterales bacterium]|nr:ice-binding family protein [Acidiferrobacterales bacterium]